jgi:hypothetical protein
VRRRGCYVVLAVFVAVSAGWVGFRALTGRHDPVERSTVAVRVAAESPAAAAATPASAAAGPKGDSSGIPVGYLHTEAGARAAAVGWVSSLGALIRLGPIAAQDAVRALTSKRVAESTIDKFRADRDRFADQFGADPANAIWIESPLAVHTVEWSPDRAVVAVWSQLVVGAPTGNTVQALWRTHTVTVVWEGDDWRVDDVTEVEGPTPDVAPGDLPVSGADFAPLAEWTPAVLAGSSVESR